MLAVALGTLSLLAPQDPVHPLTAENFTAWRDHLLPRPAELRWESIPWRPTFAGGVLAANEAKKPLLFWAMNGHPLGCT